MLNSLFIFSPIFIFIRLCLSAKFRYEEGHAIRHWNDSQHCYSLELETQQIWDYVGDKYVHRLNQSKIDAKSVSTNFRCSTCGYNEDSGISSALVSSKGEAVLFLHLLIYWPVLLFTEITFWYIYNMKPFHLLKSLTEIK